MSYHKVTFEMCENRGLPCEPVNVKETSLCKDDGVYDRLLRLMLENCSKSGDFEVVLLPSSFKVVKGQLGQNLCWIR